MLHNAYVAGIFDGEGHISFLLRKDTGYLKCEIGISGSEPELMDALLEKYPEGNVFGHDSTNRQMYNFRISGTYLARFMSDIREFVLVKQKELAFYDEWLAQPQDQPRNRTQATTDWRADFIMRYKQWRKEYSCKA